MFFFTDNNGDEKLNFIQDDFFMEDINYFKFRLIFSFQNCRRQICEKKFSRWMR